MSDAKLIVHFTVIDILPILALWSGQTSLYLALIKMHLEGQTWWICRDSSVGEGGHYPWDQEIICSLERIDSGKEGNTAIEVEKDRRERKITGGSGLEIYIQRVQRRVKNHCEKLIGDKTPLPT